MSNNKIIEQELALESDGDTEKRHSFSPKGVEEPTAVQVGVPFGQHHIAKMIARRLGYANVRDFYVAAIRAAILEFYSEEDQSKYFGIKYEAEQTGEANMREGMERALAEARKKKPHRALLMRA